MNILFKILEKITKNISKIGLISGLIVLIMDALRPIVNNSKPSDQDALLFTLAISMIELIFVFPYYLYSDRNNKGQIDWEDEEITTSINFTKQKAWRNIIFIGFLQGLTMYISIIGFSMTDSVTGILALKTQAISMFIITVFILFGKISIITAETK